MRKDIDSYKLLYQKPFLAKSYQMNERSEKNWRERQEKLSGFKVSSFDELPSLNIDSYPLLN